MIFSFKFDKEMYRKQMEIFHNNIWTGAEKEKRNGPIVMICFIIIASIFLSLGHTLLGWGLLAFDIIYFIYWKFNSHIGVYFSFKNEEMKQLLLAVHTGELTETRLIIGNNGLFLNKEWHNFDKVYVSKDFIFLMGSASIILQSIPRQGMIEGDFQEILNAIREYYPLELIELDV